MVPSSRVSFWNYQVEATLSTLGFCGLSNTCSSLFSFLEYSRWELRLAPRRKRRPVCIEFAPMPKNRFWNFKRFWNTMNLLSNAHLLLLNLVEFVSPILLAIEHVVPWPMQAQTQTDRSSSSALLIPHGWVSWIVCIFCISSKNSSKKKVKTKWNVTHERISWTLRTTNQMFFLSVVLSSLFWNRWKAHW